MIFDYLKQIKKNLYYINFKFIYLHLYLIYFPKKFLILLNCQNLTKIPNIRASMREY